MLVWCHINKIFFGDRRSTLETPDPYCPQGTDSGTAHQQCHITEWNKKPKNSTGPQSRTITHALVSSFHEGVKRPVAPLLEATSAPTAVHLIHQPTPHPFPTQPQISLRISTTFYSIRRLYDRYIEGVTEGDCVEFRHHITWEKIRTTGGQVNSSVMIRWDGSWVDPTKRRTDRLTQHNIWSSHNANQP